MTSDPIRVGLCVRACEGISDEDLVNGVVSKDLLLRAGMSRADILMLHDGVREIVEEAQQAQARKEE